ncbi:Hypothetical protein HVR_LOCUS1105 [uncultured virus]|nr:Hypothetical protein HVR_LOCUS1105 [uncultured virus]
MSGVQYIYNITPTTPTITSQVQPKQIPNPVRSQRSSNLVIGAIGPDSTYNLNQNLKSTVYPLIDWLYAEETTINYKQPGSNSKHQSVMVDPLGSNSKQGALIVFPRMIDRWNVASSIVTNWEKYNVVIVTDHPNEFMETTRGVSGDSNELPFVEWTKLELVPFTLFKYSDISDINQALHNTEIDVILFDDARMLGTISSALNFIDVNPKIIVLSSWGDSMNQLETVTEKLPGLRLLTFDIISDISDVQWLTSKVAMSKRQVKFYDQGRTRELEESTQNSYAHVIPYPITRRLTIYAYPDNIMNEYVKEPGLFFKPICELDNVGNPDNLVNEVKPRPPDEILFHSEAPNTWLTSNYLDSISNDGPKLESILDGVVSNWPDKQIIITRFNNRFGVDLINSFLQLQINAKRNPYNINEIYKISCITQYDDNINALNRFNDASSGVLVTNIVPLISLKGISSIHIADSYSFKTIKMIIDKCHKRYLILVNNQPQDLKIYSHIATHPNGQESADVSLHNNMIKEIDDANKIYGGLIGTGDKIVYDLNNGLVVVPRST